MADKQDGFKLISVNDDADDEVVFHAGTRHAQARQAGPDPQPYPVCDASFSEATASSGDELRREAAVDPAVPEGDAGQCDDDIRAPKTAQERQRERERAQRRKLAEEVAATEADLQGAGKMSKGQIAIIAVCIVLLVITVVYVASSFIS